MSSGNMEIRLPFVKPGEADRAWKAIRKAARKSGGVVEVQLKKVA